MCDMLKLTFENRYTNEDKQLEIILNFNNNEENLHIFLHFVWRKNEQGWLMTYSSIIKNTKRDDNERNDIK